MCYDAKSFTSYEEIHDSSYGITILDGARVTVTHESTVKLANWIMLMDVLLVLRFKFSSLFVAKLCQDMAFEVLIVPYECIIQGHSKGMITVLGKLKYGLYCTQAATEHVTSIAALSFSHQAHVATSSHKNEEINLLHLRLGHLPSNKLNLLDTSLPISDVCGDTFCHIYPIARQH